jgi:hypothetical protein
MKGKNTIFSKTCDNLQICGGYHKGVATQQVNLCPKITFKSIIN